jgi:hypothetical protein
VTRPANPVRGEAMINGLVLRPSFAALVAAEEELGPLFALVDRAAEGQLRLSEMVALFWHCRIDGPATREACAACIVEAGLAQALPVLRQILHQILAGQ